MNTRSITAEYAEHAEEEAERRWFFSVYSEYSAVATQGFRAWPDSIKSYNKRAAGNAGIALRFHFERHWPSAPEHGR